MNKKKTIYFSATWVPPTDPKLWPPQPVVTQPVTIEEYAANSLVNSEEWCQRFNDAKIADYTLKVNNANQSIDNGYAAVAPLVPMAYLPIGPDINSYYSYGISTVPVCAPLALDPLPGPAPVPVPNTIDVGYAVPGGGGKWFGVGSKDTMPCGFVTPPNAVSADGITGSFEKYAAVGAGWYLLIT